MLNKKIFLLTVSAGIATALSICAFAEAPSAQNAPTPAPIDTSDDSTPITNGSGFTLGANYATWGVNNFAITAGYVNHWISTYLGASYFHNNATTATSASHIFELRGEFGLRQALQHSLFFTYGLLGSNGFRNQANLTNPYSAGAYIGLDYQPLQHLLLSTQIAPYVYMHDQNRINHSNEFSEGSIGASYIFN